MDNIRLLPTAHAQLVHLSRRTHYGADAVFVGGPTDAGAFRVGGSGCSLSTVTEGIAEGGGRERRNTKRKGKREALGIRR